MYEQNVVRLQVTKGLDQSRRDRKVNIKIDLKKQVVRLWIGLVWLRIGSNKPTGSGVGWLGEGHFVSRCSLGGFCQRMKINSLKDFN